MAMTVSVHLRLLDKLTAPMRKATQSTRKMGGSLRKMVGDANAAANAARKVANSNTQISKTALVAERRMHKLARRMRSMRTIGRGMASGGFMAGMGGGLLGYNVVNELFTFSDVMNTIDSNLGTDADRALRPQIETAVQAAAMTSKFTSVEVGEIALELARMGESAQNIINKLPAVTNFATATGGSAKEAADVLTNLAKITGKTLTQTGDLFTATFTSSPQTFHDISEGLKFSTVLLKKYKIPLEEIMATSQILGEQKVKGGMSGTATARMLNAILKPSGTVDKALKKVGIKRNDFLDNEGKLKGGIGGFLEVFEKAEKKMRESGIEDAGKRMLTAMTIMFKERGSLAFAPLYENFKEWKKRLADLQPEMVFERTSKAALERMKGVAGAIFIIKAAWSALIQDMGASGLNDDIVAIKDYLKGLIGSFKKLSPETKRFVGRAILLGTALSTIIIPLGILAMAIGALVPVIATLMSPLTWLLGAFFMQKGGIVHLASSFKKVAGFAGLAAVALKGLKGVALGLLRMSVVGGILTAGYLIYDNWNAIAPKIKSIWDGIKKAWQSFVNFFSTTRLGKMFGVEGDGKGNTLVPNTGESIKKMLAKRRDQKPHGSFMYNKYQRMIDELPKPKVSKKSLQTPTVESPFSPSTGFSKLNTDITNAGTQSSNGIKQAGAQTASGITASGQTISSALSGVASAINQAKAGIASAGAMPARNPARNGAAFDGPPQAVPQP